MVQVDTRALVGLRRQWVVVTALYAAALVLGYQVLADSAYALYSARWLALAAATMAVQLAILWWTLPLNRRRGEGTLFAALGLANSLTLARGALTCLLAGFLLAPAPQGALAWAPALLYTSERVIDFVDGWVARRSHRETELGSILDIEFDGLGILIAVTLAVSYGALPVWYLLLGVSRPLFVLGLALRRRWERPTFDLPPSDSRRVIAGLQTGFVSVVLWPVWSEDVSRWAGVLFAVPLAASFMRDWLVASGVVDAGSARYMSARRAAKRWVEGALPLLLRAVGAALALWLLPRAGLSAVWDILAAIAAVLLGLGAAGRPAALVLLVYAALAAEHMGPGWLWGAGLLMACATGVLHVGSGWYALWKTEERLIRVKLGAGAEGPAAE